MCGFDEVGIKEFLERLAEEEMVEEELKDLEELDGDNNDGDEVDETMNLVGDQVDVMELFPAGNNIMKLKASIDHHSF
jgi:hypothetical protein